MIEYIKGRLKDKDLGHIVVETGGGVGYGMDISLATYEALPDNGQECEVYTIVYVREDTFRLFGFATKEERNIFEVLISISGIGPKLSFSILSHTSIDEFGAAIAAKDIHGLTRIPGIGKKTAERLCVELKGKLDAFTKTEQKISIPIESESTGTPIEDAISGLISLGVKPVIAGSAIHRASRALGEDATVEDLIKEGLKHRSQT